ARRGDNRRAEAHGGVPGTEARTALEEATHPRGVPEHRLLRSPRVRRAGRGRDLLRAPGVEAEAHAGRAARRTAPSAIGLRPAAPAEGSAPPSQRGLAGDAGHGSDFAGAAAPRARAPARLAPRTPLRLRAPV